MVSALEGPIGRMLDALVARARTESPRTVELLAQLAARPLEIELATTPWRLRLESSGSTLVLAAATADASAPAARLVGTPLSLLSLLGGEPGRIPAQGTLRIEGDAELAQHYHELLLLLRPDLEHALSLVLGRSGAHLLMRGASATAERARTGAWSALRSLADYLAHERRDLVPRPEAEHVLRAAEQLRERLDRLDAGLTQLERRTRALRGEQEPI